VFAIDETCCDIIVGSSTSALSPSGSLAENRQLAGYHAVAVRDFTKGTNLQRVIHVLGDMPESVVSGVLLFAAIADPIAIAVANTLRRAILISLTPKILP
jgi:hypothetical protein